jgi:hypothetical protein
MPSQRKAANAAVAVDEPTNRGGAVSRPLGHPQKIPRDSHGVRTAGLFQGDAVGALVCAAAETAALDKCMMMVVWLAVVGHILNPGTLPDRCLVQTRQLCLLLRLRMWK